MFTLITTFGTNNPALLILQEKGYLLTIDWATENDTVTLFCATRNGNRFAAHTAPELLGLVTIWEHFGEDWNRQTPDLIGNLPAANVDQD